MMEEVKFTKMQGIGNDYVYIDCLDGCPENLPGLSVEMSRPHYGIGSDGIITIERSAVADFKMRIFNADGSEAKMCGNGCRCVGKYVYDKGLTVRDNITVESLSGVKKLQLHINGGKVSSVTVDMGRPVFAPDAVPVKASRSNIPLVEMPLATSFGEIRLTALSMGNPHGVVFVNDLSEIPMRRLGPELETHTIWPDRANIEFAHVISPSEIEMRVWERGSGETMACGTGACAVAVAAALTRRSARDVTIRLKGGNLGIRWNPDDDHVYMTGPAEFVFEGVYIRDKQ